MPVNFNVVRTVLTDNDKLRLIALFLSAKTADMNAIIDWEKATQDFGSKSVDSMRVSTRTIMRKIENASSILDGQAPDVNASPGPHASGDKGSRKRKHVDSGEEHAGGGNSPLAKKRTVAAGHTRAANKGDAGNSNEKKGRKTLKIESADANTGFAIKGFADRAKAANTERDEDEEQGFFG